MSTSAATASADTNSPTVAGHPPGLFVLFFAEMWERFSYYGMRALLVFYMTKGFLQYADKRAYAVYGAYTALVYATPFIGGTLADRLLGARRATVIGALLMAAGHLVMTVENTNAFFLALALIIVGNGFFKPNIGTIVGGLYAPGGKRDGGFTIFYMGVNLGAALAPLLCGYIGETYGWHYGFGLATIGMLIGLAIFVAPPMVIQAFIGLGSLVAAGGMLFFGRDDLIMLAINAPIALALVIAAGVSLFAITKGGVPNEAGRPKDPAKLSAPVHPSLPFLSNQNAVFLGIAVGVPIIATLVTRSEFAGYVLTVGGTLALGSLFLEALRSEKVERERLFVIFVMMFFSMLFWAFFEQAGSSVSNFTDRNVDRVIGDVKLTSADVGKTLTDVKVTQEFIAYPVTGGESLKLQAVEALAKQKPTVDSVTVTDALVGMGVGGTELKASVFQATNPFFILIFGLLFTMLWGALNKRNMEPSTPVKFGLGLAQLGLGFGALWYGAQHHDARGMVGMTWLILGYLLHTTGELCLSPVGLSMVTKLAPARMVSTALGAWYLATAFSNQLAGAIAGLTGVHEEEGGGPQVIPLPTETVGTYGDVFGKIGIACAVATVLILALSPILKKWMHEEPGHSAGGGGH